MKEYRDECLKLLNGERVSGMIKVFRMGDVKKLLYLLNTEECTMSRFIEVLNEMVHNYYHENKVL